MAPYHREPASTPIPRPAEPPASAGLDLEFVLQSDEGRQRGHNEDYLGYSAPETTDEIHRRGWLFAVADGVGGQDL
jgi:serine/threonine protein phosphatase PrpC